MTHARHEVSHEHHEVETNSGVPVSSDVTVVRHPGPVAADERYESAVVTDPYSERRLMVTRLEQGIYLLFGIIEGLIAIRFALKLLGANPAAGFADFIYTLSGPFVAPFVGIFPSFAGDGASVMEPHSVVAIIVYALLSWMLVKVVWLVWGETRTGVSTSSRTVKSRLH